MWANLRGFEAVFGGYDFVNCGFPYPIREMQYFVVDCLFDVNEQAQDASIYLPWNIAKNVGVALAVLLIVAIVCEGWIRRKRNSSMKS